jgi:2-pyrone-4,6-dicarboxylate lactonase
LPAGSVDAHCHVFGPGAEFPFAPDRKYTPCDTSKQHLYALRDHPNVWSKVTCPERLSVAGPPALNGEQNPYRDVIPFARRIVETFPDRVLWGTDWPHPNLKGHMPDDGLLVDFIPHITVTPELRQKLLVDNPMRLYWPEEA